MRENKLVLIINPLKKNNFKKIKLGIIGCGNIAKFHIESLKEFGIKPLHCAASPNSSNIDKFANKHGIVNVWKDPIKLASLSNLWDGIILCSSINSIPKLLDILIKKKKPILVEKPVSTSTKYLKKFKNSNNKKIIVAYNRRFYPNIAMAKKFIENSTGSLLCKMSLPEVVFNTNNSNKKFENIFRNSAHGIDILLYLFGKLEITHISKINLQSFDSGRVVIFKTMKKHTCILTINSNSPSNFSLELEDGYKRILIEPFEDYKLYRGIDIIEPRKKYPVRKYSPKLIESKDIFNFDKNNKNLKPGFYKQTFEFLNLIKNKESFIASNLKEAYIIQNILKKIMLS